MYEQQSIKKHKIMKISIQQKNNPFTQDFMLPHIFSFLRIDEISKFVRINRCANKVIKNDSKIYNGLILTFRVNFTLENEENFCHYPGPQVIDRFADSRISYLWDKIPKERQEIFKKSISEFEFFVLPREHETVLTNFYFEEFKNIEAIHSVQSTEHIVPSILYKRCKFFSTTDLFIDPRLKQYFFSNLEFFEFSYLIEPRDNLTEECFPLKSKNLPKLKILETYNWLPNLNFHPQIQILFMHFEDFCAVITNEEQIYIKYLIIGIDDSILWNDVAEIIDLVVTKCKNLKQIYFLNEKRVNQIQFKFIPIALHLNCIQWKNMREKILEFSKTILD